MAKEHHYSVKLTWNGNTGSGTKDYRTYERSHVIKIKNKADIHCSSDPAFRGDVTKHNPEEMLLASVSSCHMLWYLHLCSTASINVLAYSDEPTGVMIENKDGSGRFTEISLNPSITLADASMKAKADALHEKANKLCFIANSLNFPVHHKAKYDVGT
ncbi:OsmC family protein [Arcticibacterium luteifluviistationis]|uniref:Peroxiredoxin n=1 Tax=Arcticibacterium luteifluviistationis TaxID=1784714 RepID=A0A2Z4GAZ7_9BACT|nr:OsmC family protein [Arcticibacterium luteifluviistationis]AWV98245.1 peroxiredoxin [Arcticibacterium luteifluviistationis]